MSGSRGSVVRWMVVGIVVAASAVGAGPAAWAAECVADPAGVIRCGASGGSSSGGSSSGSSGDLVGVTPERPPIRYLKTSIDPVVGTCYFWSRTPGGIDTWDPALSDQVVIDTLFSHAPCPTAPGEAVVAVDAADAAWDVFRTFVLVPPVPRVEPAAGGIAGLPVFVSAATPSPVVHVETLPDGRTMRVHASVVEATVAWGDGFSRSYAPELLRPYPVGTATHTYAYRTCDAAYRAVHPAAATCHPTLDAYPMWVTFTWSGRYDAGAGWLALGDVALSAGVAYDVDEVVGILGD